MITLPASITAHLANDYTAPIIMADITFPDAYVKRIATMGCTFGGNAYAAEIKGNAKIEQTLQGKFDDCDIEVINTDGYWSTILNSYTVPEIQQATLAVYQGFAGLTDRVQIYSGKLDIPKDLCRKSFTIRSTQILNSITEQFNRVVFSPTCQWAANGLFADGARCTYDGSTVGRRGALTADLDDSSATVTLSHSDYYTAGECVTIDTETMRITTVGSGTLTVTRGVKDTTKAAHTTGATVTHATCCGSYASCKAKNLPWRYGGYEHIPQKGTYTYGTHVFLWKWQNTTASWENKTDSGLFGSPWGVLYGEIRLSPLCINFKDTGPCGCYVHAISHGPIENLVAAPTTYPIGDTTPNASGGPFIVINGQRQNDYSFLRGQDGVNNLNPQQVYWDTQGVSGYWASDFPSGHETVTYDTGQTLSHLAYIAGAYQSPVQTAEGFPEVLVWAKGKLLQKYDSAGAVDGVPVYSNNPAWVLVDMLTNPEYGAGVPVASIDWPAIVTAAADYDTAGFSFNAHLTSKMPFIDALKLVANACRSYVTYTDGKIGIKFIQSSLTSTGVTITSADVIADSWKYWTTSGIDRDANVLEFKIQDSAYDYESVPVQFIDQEHIDAIGKKKQLELDVTGITGIEQAKAIGTWNLNLCKMSRRQDGARQLTVRNKYLALQPGDIITVDLSDLDGQASCEYMVWSTKRNNNDGDVQLELIKWDTGLFDLDGINYDTPSTQVSPSAYPVDVTGLAGTVTASGALNLCTVTWTWADSDGTRPRPDRLYLYAGDATDGAETYQLLTPAGLQRPVSSYTWEMDPSTAATVRVVAVAQSAYGVPADPAPRYGGSATYTTTLSAACAETDTEIDVTSAAALSIVAGDEICIASATTREICKVTIIATNHLTLENSSGVRLTKHGTPLQAHALGAAVSKAVILNPYTDLTPAVLADTAVPSAPSGIYGTASDGSATIGWTKPATNALSLVRYVVTVGPGYTYAGGLYTIPGGETYDVPAAQTEATVAYPTGGQVAVGVQAENQHGLGPMGILWEEY